LAAVQTTYDLAQGTAWEYRTWSGLAREVFTPSLVACGWPFLVAIAVLRTGWVELVWGALITTGWSAVNDAGRVAFVSNRHVEYDISTPVSYPLLSQIDLIYHAAMMAVGLALVVYQVRLLRRVRRGASEPREAASRPSAIFGRLTIVCSLLYGMFVIGNQVWVVYEHFGLQIDAFRKLMAYDPESGRYGRRRRGPYDARIDASYAQFQDAMRYANAGNYEKAQDSYVRSISTLEGIAKQRGDNSFLAAERGQALNNLAWLLATCADASKRRPQQAVIFAQRAVELMPGDGTYWNTLGAALYRDGQFIEAVRALDKAMSLRKGGDAYDWFFLAMAYRKLDQPAEADRWFDKAVEARGRARNRDRELYRFHREAAELLGRDLPAPPGPPESMGSRARATVLPGGSSSTPIE
jgi:tetratricopeptide (TPR) repeat protein